MAKRYYMFTPNALDSYQDVGGIVHFYFTADAVTSVAIERVDVSWVNPGVPRDTFSLGLYRYPDLATLEGDDPDLPDPVGYDGGYENSTSSFQALDMASGPCVTTVIMGTGGQRSYAGPWRWLPTLDDQTHSFDVSQFGGFNVTGDALLRMSFAIMNSIDTDPGLTVRMAIFFSEETVE